jgi:hypothetical protein
MKCLLERAGSCTEETKGRNKLALRLGARSGGVERLRPGVVPRLARAGRVPAFTNTSHCIALQSENELESKRRGRESVPALVNADAALRRVAHVLFDSRFGPT